MFRVDREGCSVVVINIYINLPVQYNVLRGMSSRKNRKLVEAADTKKNSQVEWDLAVFFAFGLCSIAKVTNRCAALGEDRHSIAMRLHGSRMCL